MKKIKRVAYLGWVIAAAFGIALAAAPGTASAHCDALDGPVVGEAMAALQKGDVTPVLKWVKKEHEEDIRAVFTDSLAVRGQGKQAQRVADRHFLETLVRLHRAAEGAPFSGLKPAGAIEPSVAAADKTIVAGSADALARTIGQAAEKAVQERFARLKQAKAHKDDTIQAGREYVEAYVSYVHFVEGLHNSLAKAEAHEAHAHEAKAHQAHAHEK